MNNCFCHYKNLILIYLYMDEYPAIAAESGDKHLSSKFSNVYEQARSLRDAAAEQARSLRNAAAPHVAAVGRLATKDGRAAAAREVVLAPFSTKHQHYYEVIEKFLKLRDDKGGSIDNINIGEFKDFFKEFAASKDVLKDFVDTILKEIKDPNETKRESINGIINEMSSGDLAFGLKLRKSDRYTPWSSIKDDKLATVEKVLAELLELIRGDVPVAVVEAVPVAVPVAVQVANVEENNAGGSGVKRKKSKAQTFKKKYLRRKTSKKRRQKKTTKKGDKKRRQKKATKKRA